MQWSIEGQAQQKTKLQGTRASSSISSTIQALGFDRDYLQLPTMQACEQGDCNPPSARLLLASCSRWQMTLHTWPVNDQNMAIIATVQCYTQWWVLSLQLYQANLCTPYLSLLCILFYKSIVLKKAFPSPLYSIISQQRPCLSPVYPRLDAVLTSWTPISRARALTIICEQHSR